ncbi:NADH-quinone oxidoreductase subunit G [Nocardioides jishulii]|uniref:NADH-quinone oxidoreductase n=1 Tax=Nocardioides jishulii TaxID=2575440 RepID=A0A4U2YUN9_9ACTN|nr:NADH-quinone oxidoreductase subunit G [Nocardioides jishulii]QCX28665.1 NADH-quinone oxidoreductase subunit G [Nocardioides jishulii]TKI64442.1 NADH-quinone oxidoreductase subunit G [Nocardioides jishulii]
MTTNPTAPKATDEVTLTIDGITTTAPKGSLVIRAAEQVGVQIPRFCDHPLLKPAGACRQCLVEVALPGPDGELRQMQGPPGRMKPQPSCTLVVSEGMQVNTQLTSAGADKAQQGVMELLLINHPLDCPVCDKGGECPLQNQAMSNGAGESRFAAQHLVKRTFPKPINLSPQILLDRERCIVCQRCTRFADEIAGDPFIALIERGASQQIGIAPDAPFLSYFAGNTIQICPVGALTSEEYRFRARPFDLVSSPSVAEHDSCGAAIRVDHRRGKVVRRLAGDDPEVNEEWITDKDRFAFSYTRSATRLTHPMVRDRVEDGGNGELRPASWPEAFAVAARGLAAGAGAVLTGGRVTAEDAYAYSKFARVALGTNDIDFRARPHTAEEADFLAAHVVMTAHYAGGVTYSDLDAAGTVVLAGFEPEDEAGTIFLRLRKAVADHGTKVVAVAPFTSRGLRKLSAEVHVTAPGDEAAALAGVELGAGDVLLVGERLGAAPGALRAAADLVARTGARLAWVPRRAGDRGAVDAGCLPNLLPGARPVADAAARVDVATAWGVDSLPSTVGRDGDAIVAAALAGQVSGLVVGGVDPDDTADPAAFRAALEAASFVVALEQRETDVVRAADVVFPVAPVTDKAGTFVTWDGRARQFDAVLSSPSSLPDLRILAGIAEEMGSPLGWRTTDEVRRELLALGAWDGERAAYDVGRPPVEAAPAAPVEGSLRLVTWKQLVDLGTLQSYDAHHLATARPAVVKVAQADLDALGLVDGAPVTVVGDRGEVVLPVEVADLPTGTAWIPTRSFGRGVWADLASPGSSVVVKGVQ